MSGKSKQTKILIGVLVVCGFLFQLYRSATEDRSNQTEPRAGESAQKSAVAEQAQKSAVAEQAQKSAVAEQAQKSAVAEQAQKSAVAEQAQKTYVDGPHGKEDIRPTLDRIERGERHPHRNDGSVFQNREKRLPIKPRGHYREYVHPPDAKPVGPQRVVLGEDDEIFYTPDHYKTFQEVDDDN